MSQSHIEVNNRMIIDALKSKLEDLEEEQKIAKFVSCFADFDNSRYELYCDDKENINISLSLTYWDTLENDANVSDFLDNIYGNTLAKKMDTRPDYNISYNINIKELAAASKEDQEKTINEISRLKRNCFAAAFNVHFEAHRAKTNPTKTVIPFRADETMFIRAKGDNVVVIFSTTFKDADDQILAKVFLSEFADSRVGRKAGLSPPNVLYSQTPPAEIANDERALTGPHVYYLTFVLVNSHIELPEKADKTIDLIHTFRTYLHYHIKCSKAYIHQRMRAKTNEFLQILNRAKPDNSRTPAFI